LTDSGGTCVCPSDSPDPTCADDLQYNLCLGVIRRDFITGTAAILALTSFCMGLFANMPIALAPGMGLNAYFTYTVVGFHGLGPVSYSLALTAVFVEGFVFVGLSLLGLRQWLARVIPASIKLASGVGIGLYLSKLFPNALRVWWSEYLTLLAIIGMTYSAGIGVVTGAASTPLELAGCLAEELVDGVCPGSTKMRSPMMWIGIFCGGFLTAILLAFKVKGAIIAGILLVSVISWPRPTPVTYFPHTPVGDDNFDFFKKVVTFHGIQNTLVAQDWNVSGVTGQFGLALITFLYVDILDCTGTLYSMARFSGAIDEETQDFEGSAVAYLVDGASITFLRTSQLTLNSIRHLHWVPFWSLACYCVHRIRCWDLRRRQDRPHSHGNWHLLFHLHFLRSHLCLYPTVGHRLYTDHRRCHDGFSRQGHKLEVLG
jgi:AGZA family xanthine/uracil permease-like MFS transporter